MQFKSDGIRALISQLDSKSIGLLKREWQHFAQKLPKYKKGYRGQGIVYTAGGVGYTTCAIVSISMLRKQGCKLPVELWYLGDELSTEVIGVISALNVRCRNFLEVSAVNLSGYMLKPLAIINSGFEEVLFLDADNNCVTDPSDLFTSEEYLETGALFWPDYWKTDKTNPIWSIVESDEYEIFEQESGQILVDKRRCWRELQLCLHFNQLNDYYYKIIHGDKDTFKFAWHALKRKFSMVKYPVGSCGYKLNGFFFGTTMVQHGPDGKIIFLHRNLLKWDVTREYEFTWKAVKTFQIRDKSARVFLFDSASGSHLAIDLEGKVIEDDFNTLFGDYEVQCLKILSEWRSSEVYRTFLEYSHFRVNRYSKLNPTPGG